MNKEQLLDAWKSFCIFHFKFCRMGGKLLSSEGYEKSHAHLDALIEILKMCAFKQGEITGVDFRIIDVEAVNELLEPEADDL